MRVNDFPEIARLSNAEKILFVEDLMGKYHGR